ncbi:MAG: hypothetical protein QOJ35_1924 [Solirubrobacteraceae bacterium]|nr:hypothetical protein [Solirubrobacteraceae bacterium]
MATLTNVHISSITNSPTPGTSDVKIKYTVKFDSYDRAVDQAYQAHVDIIGDDTNVPGDHEVPAKDDQLWGSGLGTVKASIAPPPHTSLNVAKTIHVPTSKLDEDHGGSTPNPDEIRVRVTLTPTPVHTPAKVSRESDNFVALTLP